MSFSALSIAMSLLLVPWDLFNSVSLKTSSSTCFCCADSLAARFSEVLRSSAFLAVRSSAILRSSASLAMILSSLACCFATCALNCCSFSSSSFSFSNVACSLSLSAVLIVLSSDKTLSRQPFASYPTASASLRVQVSVCALSSCLGFVKVAFPSTKEPFALQRYASAKSPHLSLQMESACISQQRVVNMSYQQDPGEAPSSITHHCFSPDVSTWP